MINTENNNVGVVSVGVRTPIMREGDNVVKTVYDSLMRAGVDLHDKTIIGITESVVARAQGNYVTVDEIAKELEKRYGTDDRNLVVAKPIYSRNRFSMILKGIARYADSLTVIAPDFDEVGNPSGINPFTGVDIQNYYKEICEAENCTVKFYRTYEDAVEETEVKKILYCGLHDFKHRPGFALVAEGNYFTLADIFDDRCEYGLLGSNKATEEKLKLFPSRGYALGVCCDLKDVIKTRLGVDVIVCVYGDGCFCSPVGEIWEFADPVTMPAFTDEDILLGTANEIKIKAFADDKYGDLNGDELNEAIKKEIREKEKNLIGNMASEGTTPRQMRDQIASLMDLMSGSGDKGTPVVVIDNYFKTYSD